MSRYKDIDAWAADVPLDPSRINAWLQAQPQQDDWQPPPRRGAHREASRDGLSFKRRESSRVPESGSAAPPAADGDDDDGFRACYHGTLADCRDVWSETLDATPSVDYVIQIVAMMHA